MIFIFIYIYFDFLPQVVKKPGVKTKLKVKIKSVGWLHVRVVRSSQKALAKKNSISLNLCKITLSRKVQWGYYVEWRTDCPRVVERMHLVGYVS